MQRTIFNTPVLTPCLRGLSKLFLKAKGWRISGPQPQVAKCVICAGPHTSNWDFPYMVAVVFAAGMRVNWMGKHTLFPRGLGWFMRWMGGVAVNRNQAADVVSQMADNFARLRHLHLLITPEGTRGKVDKWKTGFYRVALAAKVPIFAVTVDFNDKHVHFVRQFAAQADVGAGVAEIQQLFAGVRGYDTSRQAGS